MKKAIFAVIITILFLLAAASPVSAGLTEWAAVSEGDSQIVTMASVTPDDTYYKVMQKKPFDLMAITDAWDVTAGSSDIIVAVVDSGVDASHPDLQGNVLATGYNFVDNNTDTSDVNGHGTMIAGIIAATVDNTAGIAGATQNCLILPVRVLDANGNGTVANMAAGIRYAADNGARVINLSLGCPSYDKALEDAVNYADALGVVVVAASGNTGGAVQYPAACTNAIAVGAVTNAGAFASYSNYGEKQALVAVGSSVFTTNFSAGKHGYAVATGTSFAAPFVSALAALVLSENDALTPDAVADIMEKTATDLGNAGHDPYYGYGCVNFKAAVTLAQVG
ncbi:S8 family serine peptidase [Oscillospiraceae bacterium WX1]